MEANEGSLKNVIGSFVSSYAQRDRETDFSAWLADRLRQEMPDLPEGLERGLAQDIVAAVADYDRSLAGLNEAMDAGVSKEEWFAERMAESCADLEYDAAGERISRIGQGLTASDIQLMQEMDGTQPRDMEEMDADLAGWNQYSIKHELQEMGKKVCFAGLAVAANAIRYREAADGELSIGEAVREALREDMVTAPQEVKAVVAGAVKVAAEKRLEAALPADTSIEDISDMAGVAVEGAEALFEAAGGEISALEAADRIGRASVASACRIGKRALQGCLINVPIAGPLLVDLFGGLLEHMDCPEFHENVYQVFHDAAVATWEGIKDCNVVQIAANITKLVSG